MLLMVAAGVLLIGCAGSPPVEQQDPAARRMSIGWIRHDWRICEEEGSCPHPTPKTVALPAPMPTAPKPQEPAKPQPAAAAERNPAVVHFEFARATPTEAGGSELEGALAQVRQDEAIRIVGHTDDIGTAAFNARLALRRAEFVATWLKRRGVTNPMEIEAHGKCCYVAANDSDQGRAANRRAEIHFTTTRKEIVR
ncbi:MAG TPA: OmpA family protein [Rhodocyclaceae bacterium]|uniref:OmpA family protein n=1 Tax=Accumulibacter sp. TaxID=2053492 RepID=UPI002BCAB2D4|nr:OmpA family protein [Accumulibacter sp.]HMZ76210.1 OmpA family protein [Rhodocyclaceae bacterium]HNG14509.1 OmpA family protein [Accumulibacter sp.]